MAPDMVPLAYPDLPRPPSHRQASVNAFVFVHQTLHQANARLAKRGGATMTLTPRHYLDFVSHYVSLSGYFFQLYVVFLHYTPPQNRDIIY